MTKIEFRNQFKRLRVAGYRLPVFDGVKVDDVLDEWFGTFGGCTVQEFSQAIDRLKEAKTDTFWPSTGELWTQVHRVRKERRIRRQTDDHGKEWAMSDEDANEFLEVLRQCKDKILGRMAMPHAEPQVEPQHVIDEQARREEDEAV
jgi:hypothetical protein